MVPWVSNEFESDEASRRLKSKVFRAGLAFLISGALLGWLLSKLDLAEAWSRFQEADLRWLAAAALFSFLVLLLRGLRFSALEGTRFWLTTAAVANQNFLNRVTPLRLGELSLPYLLHRHAGADLARALVHLLLIRVIDLAVVVFAVLAGVALRAKAAAGPAFLPTLGAALLLALLLLYFRRLLRAALGAGRWLAARLGLARLPAVDRVLGKLAKAVDDGERMQKRAAALVTSSSLALFVAQVAMFGCLLLAFDVRISLSALALGGAVAQAGAAIPVASVGTFGTQEASWVAGFVWAGVSMQDALVTAVACQFLTLAFAAAFALPSWLWLQRGPRSQHPVQEPADLLPLAPKNPE